MRVRILRNKCRRGCPWELCYVMQTFQKFCAYWKQIPKAANILHILGKWKKNAFLRHLVESRFTDISKWKWKTLAFNFLLPSVVGCISKSLVSWCMGWSMLRYILLTSHLYQYFKTDYTMWLLDPRNRGWDYSNIPWGIIRTRKISVDLWI